LEEGALGEEGASLAGRTFGAQFAVRSVLEGSYSSVSEYGGRVSPLELSFSRVLQFSGLDSIGGGHTCFSWACIARCSLVQAAIVSSSSVYCTCCIPPSILHIYTLIPNWFSPGGFYPGSC
jgi:hypothetical protein